MKQQTNAMDEIGENSPCMQNLELHLSWHGCCEYLLIVMYIPRTAVECNSFRNPSFKVTVFKTYSVTSAKVDV